MARCCLTGRCQVRMRKCLRKVAIQLLFILSFNQLDQVLDVLKHFWEWSIWLEGLNRFESPDKHVNSTFRLWLHDRFEGLVDQALILRSLCLLLHILIDKFFFLRLSDLLQLFQLLIEIVHLQPKLFLCLLNLAIQTFNVELLLLDNLSQLCIFLFKFLPLITNLRLKVIMKLSCKLFVILLSFLNFLNFFWFSE